ncbi:MAG TPA: hypothetical protein PLJ27_05340 [Polyangiaceae bacterium]|nr:hypothetical protein [Polyangiaceae bacterium]
MKRNNQFFIMVGLMGVVTLSGELGCSSNSGEQPTAQRALPSGIPPAAARALGPGAATISSTMDNVLPESPIDPRAPVDPDAGLAPPAKEPLPL